MEEGSGELRNDKKEGIPDMGSYTNANVWGCIQHHQTKPGARTLVACLRREISSVEVRDSGFGVGAQFVELRPSVALM
jgi:hypothetical protein